MVVKTFASDNFSSVCTEVFEYLIDINNSGHAVSYDGDDVTQQAVELLKEAFGTAHGILFVPSGTGANILALKLLLERSYDAVVTSSVSHVYEEESGAVAAHLGAQIFPIAHEHGKISFDAMRRDIEMRRALTYHSAMPRVVSIANSTEYGTSYTPEEVQRIADYCHTNEMLLHVDGCRLANAAAAQGVDLKSLTKDVGVDCVTFGGAKNGLMAAEAVIVFNPLAADLLRTQKQSLQLVSKMRFVSGQFVPYMNNDLWRKNAQHANELATRLAAGLLRLAGTDFELTRPVDTNQVFGRCNETTKHTLRAYGHTFYDWNEPGEVRFVTAWDNTEAEVDGFLALLNQEQSITTRE